MNPTANRSPELSRPPIPPSLGATASEVRELRTRPVGGERTRPPETTAREPVHHEVVDVELLYFADCPSWYLTRERLDQALRMSGHPEVEVRLRAVETDRQARDLCFPGSPTVRVNGRDAFPTTAGTYGLTCRVYTTPDGLTGSPTVDQLVHALRAASQGHASQ